MQFVKSNRGLVNLAFVKRIETNPKGEAILFMDDGYAIADLSFEDIDAEIGTYVPDHTGTQSLHIGEDQGRVYHRKVPVVGWLISGLSARPVHAQPEARDLLLYADGTVDSLNDGTFDSVTDALNDFAKQNKISV